MMNTTTFNIHDTLAEVNEEYGFKAIPPLHDIDATDVLIQLASCSTTQDDHPWNNVSGSHELCAASNAFADAALGSSDSEEQLVRLSLLRDRLKDVFGHVETQFRREDETSMNCNSADSDNEKSLLPLPDEKEFPRKEASTSDFLPIVKEDLRSVADFSATLDPKFGQWSEEPSRDEFSVQQIPNHSVFLDDDDSIDALVARMIQRNRASNGTNRCVSEFEPTEPLPAVAEKATITPEVKLPRDYSPLRSEPVVKQDKAAVTAELQLLRTVAQAVVRSDLAAYRRKQHRKALLGALALCIASGIAVLFHFNQLRLGQPLQPLAGTASVTAATLSCFQMITTITNSLRSPQK